VTGTERGDVRGTTALRMSGSYTVRPRWGHPTPERVEALTRDVYCTYLASRTWFDVRVDVQHLCNARCEQTSDDVKEKAMLRCCNVAGVIIAVKNVKGVPMRGSRCQRTIILAWIQGHDASCGSLIRTTFFSRVWPQLPSGNHVGRTVSATAQRRSPSRCSNVSDLWIICPRVCPPGPHRPVPPRQT